MSARIYGMTALLVAVAFAGCIENMSDLKDRLQGSGADPLPTNTTDPTGKVNKTLPKATIKPVARMAIYETGGAKIFQADFVASDVQFKDAAARGGKQLSFTASESEAPNATVDKFDWSFGDGKTAKGSTATHVYSASGGVFEVVLTVTDSKGRTDTQKVKLAVKPAFLSTNESHEGTITAPVTLPGGAVSNTASVPFSILAKQDATDLTHVSTRLVLSGDGNALDLNLRVVNATGEVLGTSNGGGPNEELVLEGLSAEDLTAVITLAAGANAGWMLVIETTYEPVNHAVMQYMGADGHGHAH